MSTTALLAAARGEQPADLLLRNARAVNVFSGEIEEADVALHQGRIAGVGTGYTAAQTVDLHGAYLAPGLIDAHVHIESSLCLPGQFAAAVVPRGLTTAVIDPHEIANVAGIEGVRFMADCSRGLPLQVVVMAPSAVPATHMETSGAALPTEDLAALLAEGTVHGLAELMNFPGTVQGDPAVLSKIAAFAGRPVDGHAPELTGQALNAYAAAGAGSDHECATVAEAAEKLARGLYILMREGTNTRNLHTLLPLVNDRNSRRICFCTDDRIPGDLLTQGSIDYMLREAIAFGIEPVTAFRMAALNAAEWFGLHDRGAIAPGRRADLWVFDDLQSPVARQVYAAGRLCAVDGRMIDESGLTRHELPASVASSVKLAWDAFDLRIPAAGARVRVIVSLEDQVLTEERILDARIEDGQAVADPARDILKIAVIDRHEASGSMGLGFIQGFGLQRGAIAGTVAHDHHNLVVIGADDASMTTAARAVAGMGGGLAIAAGAGVLATLPLPVAGLMSDQPLDKVRTQYETLLDAAHEFGSRFHDPFMAMSFMGLEVIPKLKLTDQGLVDVEAFDFVDLFVEE
ncbi:MAG: adenine deaminase [Caldilineaceae bacterium]|nr:adenine deaminase [Caldilineaceae bacterium]